MSHDSETAQVYRAMKGHSKGKRGNNRKMGAKFLADKDIPFTTNNGGAHLIVEGNECFIDYWPGTGKWISRNGKKGFGVKNLIRYVEVWV